jgi:quercetin dioxygenase-like cupin family protein
VEHEEWLEQAEFCALSALDDEELAQFEGHLSAGCLLCKARVRETEEMLAQLPASLEPLTAPDRVKTRVFEAIAKEKPDYQFVHAVEGEWQEMAPGIVAKILSMDETHQRVTALVRMQKGSRYSNHRHALTEELFVIEGSCYCGGRLLKAGDYHRAEAGSIHLDTHTDEGSLMLLITSVQNEMFA